MTTAHMHTQPRHITVSQVIGELLLTFGVLLLLFAFYESYWTNIASGRMQDEVQTRLEEQWVNPRQAKTTELGNAFARMYLSLIHI